MDAIKAKEFLRILQRVQDKQTTDEQALDLLKEYSFTFSSPILNACQHLMCLPESTPIRTLVFLAIMQHQVSRKLEEQLIHYHQTVPASPALEEIFKHWR